MFYSYLSLIFDLLQESGRSSLRRRVRGRTSTDNDTRKRRQQRGRHSKVSRNGSYRASRVTVVSDQDHVSTRPQRQAARNALNLFTSIQTPGRDEDDEDSADREETVAAETVNTGQDERAPSSLTGGDLRAQLRSLRKNAGEEGEEEAEQRNQRTHASTSQPEVDNLGDCRRPRSQRPRRIKIIFNRPAGPLHGSTQSDGLGEGEARAVLPSEPPTHSDDKPLSPSPASESMLPLEQSQISHRKLIIKPPKPVSQESGSTSRIIERCSDEVRDAIRGEEMLFSTSNQESPVLGPQVARSISEEIVVEEKQWQWKKGKAIKGAQASGSSKYAEAAKDSESLESFERAILSNECAQAHTWEQPQPPDNPRSAEDRICRQGDGSQYSERERTHDANVSSEHGTNEDNLVSVHELTDTLSQKVDLNKDPDQNEQQSRDTEWKGRCEHNGNHSLMEVGSSDRSPISSGAGDLRTLRLQSTSKYKMEDKDQESPASSREVGDCVDDVDEGQGVLRGMEDSEQRLIETGCTDQETRGEYSDEDSNAARKSVRGNQRANNTCIRLEEHHSQLETTGEVASSDEEADIRRDHESYYNEDAIDYETGQDQLEENGEKQASESEMDQVTQFLRYRAGPDCAYVFSFISILSTACRYRNLSFIEVKVFIFVCLESY